MSACGLFETNFEKVCLFVLGLTNSLWQVQGSPHRFIRVPPSSPLLWVTKGYAVLDDPAMPIVGEDGKEENDNFIEQLVGSAEVCDRFLYFA